MTGASQGFLYLAAGGYIGLGAGWGLGWLRILGFWNLRLGWGREGLIPVSLAY